MPNSEKPGSLSPWRRGLMAGLPLLGVFFTGLAGAVVIDERLSLFDDTGFSEILSFSSLTLAIYAGVYAFYVFSVRDNKRSSVNIILTCLAIFAVTLLMFLPIFFVGLIAARPFGFIAAPFFMGILYGIIFSFMAGMPYRFIAHALGGGVVGLLVSFVYLAFFWLDNRSRDDADLWWPIRSATVLILCYLPHFLATRPWVPERRPPNRISAPHAHD